jgi:hypothetical protein
MFLFPPHLIDPPRHGGAGSRQAGALQRERAHIHTIE